MTLHAQDIFFRYPDQTQPAVDHVSFSLNPGEFVLLLGSNGSGKSTLVRLMSGLFLPDAGEIFVDGINTKDLEQRHGLRRKVGLVFQHPENQIVAQTVADEVAFGLENLNLPPEEIRPKVYQTLEQVGLSSYSDRPPDSLSGGQLQRLALAGVLALQPDYLFMDEPFAWLDAEAQTALLSELFAVNQAGCAVVVVSQETDLLEHVDRVWLMRDGRFISDTTPQALSEAPEYFEQADLQAPSLMTLCHHLSAHLPRSKATLNVAQTIDWLTPHLKKKNVSENDASVAHTSDQNTLLSAERVGFAYDSRLALKDWLFRDVTLDLPSGDWLILSGPSGCGKSSFVQLLNGLLRPLAGTIKLQGRDIIGQRTAQLCQHIGLVFQNPRQQFFADTVFNELSYALQEHGCSNDDIQTRTNVVCRRLKLDTNILQRAPQRLSGGEQLKVALGSLLLLEPNLLILDETLTSLDPIARIQTLELLKKLNEEGLTIITVSHRPAQMLPFAKRIANMQSGQLSLFDAATAPTSWLPQIVQLSNEILGERLFDVDEVYRGILERLEHHP